MMERPYMKTYLSKIPDDETWLMNELKKRSLNVLDISYAVVGTKGNLYIELLEKNT